MVQQPWRLGPRGRRVLDLAIVGLLVLLAVPIGLGGDPGHFVLTVSQVVPLLWRRQHPVAVFAVVVTMSLVQVLTYPMPIIGQLAFPLALYAVARYSTAAAGAAALATGLVGALVGPWHWLGHWDAREWNAMVSYVLTVAAIVTAAWALGTMSRVRARYIETLIERGHRLEREAAQQAAIAAAEERARIAREMHDVVAHGLSVIVVQADGARYAAEQDPRAATTALETIGRTGRTALAEMRKMLGLLRSDEATAVAPQPDLADLPALVEDARQAGMQVSAHLPEGDPRVPAGVALSTYRVVQEALTNVRKHAGPDVRVDVDVAVTDADVQVRVSDDGRGAAAADDGHGQGLLGMRERVQVHGGELHHGPRRGGGFEVCARIPL